MSLLAPQVLTVDHLTAYIKAVFDEDPIMSDVWVRGEVTNFHRSQAGHCYFSLSCEGSQIRCVLFRGHQRSILAMPINGDEVLAHGSVSIYESSGQYQLYVDNIAPAGTGIQQLQFEELRRKLEVEGLFAIDRKRPLPERPVAIGVVTSAQGAVWHDIQTVIARRYPLTRLVLAPAAVQGPGAPTELIASMQALQSDPDVDVIIIGRGGGSAEDLACFNDEALARAIYACQVPVVSAIGHETDTSIADLVSDVRAATPSAAAELCVPSSVELLRHVANQLGIARECLDRSFARSRHDLAILRSSLSRCSPMATINSHRQDLDLQDVRRRNSMHRKITSYRTTIAGHRRTAQLLDPRDVLRRGYALVVDDADDSNGRISSAASARNIETLRVTFHDNSVRAKVVRNGEQQ